jgi:uncharacterized protein YndB with AHSA1/START domain
MPIVEHSIIIRRPPATVFQFISDYERDPQWRSEVRTMTFQDEGPTRVGRRVLEQSLVFGQRLETLTEVAEYVQDERIVSITISGATPVTAYRSVTPLEAGTRFLYRLDVDVSKAWFFRVLSPVIMPI